MYYLAKDKMKKLKDNIYSSSFIGLLLFVSQVASAQVTENFSFLGVLETPDHQVMTYRLDLEILDGVVSGTSLMDIDGPNATTASISGQYDYNTKVLNFTETKVLSSKAPLDGDFCFISIKAKMTVKKKKSHLNGDFWGLADKKDSCVIGTVNMVATSYLMKKIATVEKVIKKSGIKDSAILAKADTKELEKSVSILKISSAESVSINVDRDRCLLKIWDDGIVDGDRISIRLNGVVLLYNYVLKKEVKSIGIHLEKGANTLELLAHNTGGRSPNTAYLTIEDSTSKTKLSSNLKKDQTATIIVVY